jgi:hypothetical protein
LIQSNAVASLDQIVASLPNEERGGTSARV